MASKKLIQQKMRGHGVLEAAKRPRVSGKSLCVWFKQARQQERLFTVGDVAALKGELWPASRPNPSAPTEERDVLKKAAA